MLENPRRGRQARRFTTNVPKIAVGCPWIFPPLLTKRTPCIEFSLLTLRTTRVKISRFFYESDKYLCPLTVVGVVVCSCCSRCSWCSRCSCCSCCSCCKLCGSSCSWCSWCSWYSCCSIALLAVVGVVTVVAVVAVVAAVDGHLNQHPKPD